MGTWCKDLWSWCKDFLASCRDFLDCCKGFLSCRRLFFSCCREFLTEPVFKKYLFSWDNVSGNNGDKKILQNFPELQSFLRDDLAYLFSISSNFKPDLENNNIYDLKKVFRDKKHPLSINAKISKLDKDEWKIEDEGKEYKIIESNNKLKIYDSAIVWEKNAEIQKRHDGKSIRIRRDENAAKIKIDVQEEKATLKISYDRTIDLKVKTEDGKRNIYFIEFPHSKVWRVLVSIIFVIISPLLWKAVLMDLIIIPCNFWAPWAMYFLWELILYLSVILWLPIHNIWECIERVNYVAVDEKEFRQQISGNLNTVSTLVAFSIAFIVLSMSIYFTTQLFSNVELNVFKLVMGLLVVGAIFLVVTLEAYDSCLNPAFNSAQIERLYTKGWWLYTFGIYSIVVALLLYIYLLEPLITIMGVLLFMVTFSIYLKTECNIKPKCNQSIKRRIDK